MSHEVLAVRFSHNNNTGTIATMTLAVKIKIEESQKSLQKI